MSRLTLSFLLKVLGHLLPQQHYVTRMIFLIWISGKTWSYWHIGDFFPKPSLEHLKEQLLISKLCFHSTCNSRHALHKSTYAMHPTRRKWQVTRTWFVVVKGVGVFPFKALIFVNDYATPRNRLSFCLLQVRAVSFVEGNRCEIKQSLPLKDHPLR